MENPMENPVNNNFEKSAKSAGGKADNGTVERRRGLAIFLLIVLCAGVVGLSYLFYRPMLKMAETPELFREYMWDKAPLSILLFMAAVFAQVVAAVIPGGPFEIAAGYAFGALWGTLITDFAMTLASLFVFLMVRKFGMKFATLFVSEEKINSLKFLKYSPRRDFIAFLFFLIPGTPKDIFTYFMGLTDMKVYRWIIIAFVGRLPAIYLSALSGSAAGDKNYTRVAVMFGVIIVLFVGGSIAYEVWRRKNAAASSSGELSDEPTDGESS